jgi:hypothetical protein
MINCSYTRNIVKRRIFGSQDVSDCGSVLYTVYGSSPKKLGSGSPYAETSHFLKINEVVFDFCIIISKFDFLSKLVIYL